MAEIYSTTQEVKEEDKAQNFKFIFLFIILLIVVAAGVAGISYINNSSESPTPERSETNLEDDTSKSIYTTIEADDSFKKLEELIIIADLADVLKNPDQELTLLAPTDESFDKVKATIDKLVEDEDTTRLREILLSHVVASKKSASDLAQLSQIETLNAGSVLSPSVENGELKLKLNDSTTTVFSPDIETKNGYIQVVDTVLIP